MVLTAEQSMQFCKEHIQDLDQLSKKTGHNIILCPSFPMIGAVHYLTTTTHIKLGAQTCSSFPLGPYTGEVSALSLKEFGCHFCIVGHSDRRINCHETDSEIAAKVRILLSNNMSPILCIGEREDSMNVSRTKEILQFQLEPIYNAINDLDRNTIKKTLWIAYEPVWAIGTGRFPQPSYLHEVYDVIDKLCDQVIPKGFAVRYLYGGSVNEKTIGSVTNIGPVDGFLIGAASLDFQKFKNLVSFCI